MKYIQITTLLLLALVAIISAQPNSDINRILSEEKTLRVLQTTAAQINSKIDLIKSKLNAVKTNILQPTVAACNTIDKTDKARKKVSQGFSLSKTVLKVPAAFPPTKVVATSMSTALTVAEKTFDKATAPIPKINAKTKPIRTKAEKIIKHIDNINKKLDELKTKLNTVQSQNVLKSVDKQVESIKKKTDALSSTTPEAFKSLDSIFSNLDTVSNTITTITSPFQSFVNTITKQVCIKVFWVQKCGSVNGLFKTISKAESFLSGFYNQAMSLLPSPPGLNFLNFPNLDLDAILKAPDTIMSISAPRVTSSRILQTGGDEPGCNDEKALNYDSTTNNQLLCEYACSSFKAATLTEGDRTWVEGAATEASKIIDGDYITCSDEIFLFDDSYCSKTLLTAFETNCPNTIKSIAFSKQNTNKCSDKLDCSIFESKCADPYFQYVCPLTCGTATDVNCKTPYSTANQEILNSLYESGCPNSLTAYEEDIGELSCEAAYALGKCIDQAVLQACSASCLDKNCQTPRVGTCSSEKTIEIETSIASIFELNVESCGALVSVLEDLIYTDVEAEQFNELNKNCEEPYNFWKTVLPLEEICVECTDKDFISKFNSIMNSALSCLNPGQCSNDKTKSPLFDLDSICKKIPTSTDLLKKMSATLHTLESNITEITTNCPKTLESMDKALENKGNSSTCPSDLKTLLSLTSSEYLTDFCKCQHTPTIVELINLEYQISGLNCNLKTSAICSSSDSSRVSSKASFFLATLFFSVIFILIF